MSAGFLIIDGYNLMHAAGLVRATYGPGDLSRLRHQLLVKLTKLLTPEEQKRCTVVFDAIEAPANLPGRYRHGELSVIFAERGHEADETIEELIRQHSAPRRLMVVSSDHRLQKAINRRRGSAVDSDVFLQKFESPNRRIGPPSNPSKSPRPPEKELEFWLGEFENVQPDSLARDEAPAANPQNSWDRTIKDLQDQLNDSAGLDEWLNEDDRR